MRLFFLSILFYFQNIIISFFTNFSFIVNIFEFSFIYILVLSISKFKYSKQILYFWQSFYLIHFIFLTYFGSIVTYIDIYLFFTHIEDTFTTLFYMINTIKIPIFISLIMYLILYKIKIKPINISYKFLTLILIVLFFMIPKINDTSLILIKELFQVYKIYNKKEIINKKTKTIKPIYQNDINIILVLGESMRAKEYLEKKYTIFENYNYKTIYSGATNTDVSIPLLLNGALRPKKINDKYNLFYLAKQNNFNTTFISTQSSKSLKYIKPYLNIKYINNYKVLKSLDKNLINELNNINFSKNNLIVLQMQGQHSPYIYYPNSKRDESIKVRYQKSMQYSNKILEQLLNIVKEKSKKPYLFLFTSDHGEFIGENGKFGHNKFEEVIYKVPFFYKSFYNLNLLKIKNHNDIYKIIFHYLGYSKIIKYSKSNIIYGTMITEEDGFIFESIIPQFVKTTIYKI
jgi:glucan phosphoethanolaminetransferase (alkaline phosphatase superfamily)